jgi:hypothetical protein
MVMEERFRNLFVASAVFLSIVSFQFEAVKHNNVPSALKKGATRTE